MKVNEIFTSIQGEGIYIGIPTTFIRMTGCNLRCAWCDTQYAYGIGKDMNLDDICDKIKTKYVCITGGEPLLQDDLNELLVSLIRNGHIIIIETNGSIPLKCIGVSWHTLHIAMDVKCPSAKLIDYEGIITKTIENLDYLKKDDQLKFIIADKNDYYFARDFIRCHKIPDNIIFSPVYGIDGKDLVECVLEDELDVRVLCQLHKVFRLEEKCNIH